MNETTDATAIFAPLWKRKWLILIVGLLVGAATYIYYDQPGARLRRLHRRSTSAAAPKSRRCSANAPGQRHRKRSQHRQPGGADQLQRRRQRGAAPADRGRQARGRPRQRRGGRRRRQRLHLDLDHGRHRPGRRATSPTPTSRSTCGCAKPAIASNVEIALASTREQLRATEETVTPSGVGNAADPEPGRTHQPAALAALARRRRRPPDQPRRRERRPALPQADP